jgi:hypothetical protein
MRSSTSWRIWTRALRWRIASCTTRDAALVDREMHDAPGTVGPRRPLMRCRD